MRENFNFELNVLSDFIDDSPKQQRGFLGKQWKALRKECLDTLQEASPSREER